MTRSTVLWMVGALLLASCLVFWLFERQLSGSWLAFGVHPQIVEALESSLEDQKRLAELDPESREAYRARFADIETLRGRLRILLHSQESIRTRYGLFLLALMGLVAAVGVAVSVLRQRRIEARLERLGGALEALSAGETDLRVGEGRRDLLGRIAGMIEETSRVMARDRRRLEALENLSTWQEAARRHAHEIRTPLTAARLEVDRLRELAQEGDDPAATRQALAQAADHLTHELERLATFTRGFASFARLPPPELRRLDLAAFANEVVETFERAWPRLTLGLDPPPPGPPGAFEVEADRELLRQVLVNLCDNAQRALGPSPEPGSMRLRLASTPGSIHLEVADEGPGLPSKVRKRLFEPYVTTRTEGQGMGLGLAIAKKILLDHRGDLELMKSGPRGTTFRLVLPRPSAESPGENVAMETPS